jgi:predicted amidohydrolase
MKIKIAVVQFEIIQHRPDENIKKCLKYLKQAVEKEANVILFPEDFIQGCIFNRKEYFHLVDHTGKYRRMFQEWAVKYNIDIVTGSIIEGEKINGEDKWFNVSYYINSQGKIKARYKKVNLWLPERYYLTAGEEIPVFQTRYGKAGIIICWDLIFPEVFRAMARKGVKIIYCPSFWSLQDAGIGIKYNKNAEVISVDALCVARAYENGIVLAFSNAAGRYSHREFSGTLSGGSQITVPFLGAVSKLNHNREGILVQDVDTRILDDAEKSYKIRKDLKFRLVS